MSPADAVRSQAPRMERSGSSRPFSTAKLAYDGVLAEVAGHAGSGAGRDALKGRALAATEADASGLRRETLEAASMLERGFSPDLGFLDRLIEAVESLEKGAIVLEPAELRDLGACLECLCGFRSSLAEMDEPCLSPAALRLPDPSAVAAGLLRITTPDGEISPGASKRLPGLRRKLSSARSRAESETQRLYRLHSSGGVLRDLPPSVRNGRHVLPVLATARREVPGIVHDVSETGQTLFVEPLELVEAANAVQEARRVLETELRRIRREATESVREWLPALSNAVEELARMDAVFARAGFHLARRTVFPEVSDELRLLSLAHPLLEEGEVIRNDLELPVDWRVLVISGPNAGGKTVFLKAVGLSILCAQNGLGAFAAPGSSLPFFGSVHVLIGDEQSISDHLSTYSARLGQQRELLARGGEGSIALIDEPAAGTDPAMGTAIAAAVLEELARLGYRVIATTHLGQLKDFAAIVNGFLNGAMGFDPDGLKPDFRLSIGEPGSSFAFEIAQRMGLPRRVTDRATEIAGEEYERERLIEELASGRKELSKRLEALSEEHERADRTRRMLEEEKHDLEERKTRELESLEQRIERMLHDLGSRADSLLARLSRADGRDRAGVRREIRDFVRDSSVVPGEEKRSGSRRPAGAESPPLEPGIWVIAEGWEGKGVIERVSGDRALVSFGNLAIERRLDQLTPAAPPESSSESLAGWDVSSVSAELDLRGLDQEAALSRLDERLDDCIAADMGYLRIIHGKGKGILMKAVVEMLRRDRRVDSFRQGARLEGGTGVTIATLRTGSRKD